MRATENDYIIDTGTKLWGGDVHEGLCMSSLLCPGHNTIAAYIDKKLPAKVRSIVESHMSSCKECRTEIFELRKILKSLEEE